VETTTLADAVRAALRAAHGRTAPQHAQISELDGRVYLRTRNPRILSGAMISVAIDAAPGLVLAGVTAAIPPVYCIRRHGEA
jgi:tetrahydromethanopterin S-methyltransferase subunit F